MSRKFRLEIKCDNAAFEGEDCKCEVVRILQVVTSRVGIGADSGTLYDINGNCVGWFDLNAPEEDDQ